MSTHFDLIVIGTGSGNSILNEEFESQKVAIVERDVFGGTCLNRGCIPSKMFIYPADIVQSVATADNVGVTASVESVDFASIQERTFSRIDPIAEGGQGYRTGQEHVTVFLGNAQFVGPKTIEVNGEHLTADNIVIAAGARSVIPAIDGLGSVNYCTSDSVMRLKKRPNRMVIVGSGFIALEMGHVFQSYGTDVTVLARGETVLRSEDETIQRIAKDKLKDRLNICDNVHLSSVSEHDGVISLVGTQAGEGIQFDCDELLIATGRQPNGDELGVAAYGIDVDEFGYIVVDDYQQTTAAGVFALGDVCNPMQLKHVANHEARVVQHNLLHPNNMISSTTRVVPHAVFTYPQIASVGETEQFANTCGRDIATYVQNYGDTAYGWAMNDTTSVLKVIADRATNKLIGAHCIGREAASLLQPLVMAMQFDLKIPDVAHNVMYPHPALSEVVENALIGLLGELASPDA